jgi:hypothetical protein
MAKPAVPLTVDSIAKHVQGLLGTQVHVKKLPAQELKGPLVVGLIHDEADRLVCTIVADLAAAGSCAAALSRVPAGVIQDLVRKSAPLDEVLMGNYHEVVNVLTVLTTAALGRRTVLRSVEQSASSAHATEQALIKEAAVKMFLQVAVHGYAPGGMNLSLTA